MDLIPASLVVPVIAVALPALARSCALLLLTLVATFARRPERRQAARRTLAVLLGDRRGDRTTEPQ